MRFSIYKFKKISLAKSFKHAKKINARGKIDFYNEFY